MSIFKTVDVPCPTCQTQVAFEMVHSVNADRRHDLRAAILDRSFQRQSCPACSTCFRMAPEFTYINIASGQFFAIWPVNNITDWAAHEARSQTAFDKAFGKNAPPEARQLGQKLQARVVFGWAALNEKILAQQYGLDDVLLELTKIGVIRNLDAAPIAGHFELRLVDKKADQLMLGWVETRTDTLTDVISVPRAALDEIAADMNSWAELRDGITAGLWVDMQREMMAV
jgi:hypothetical protein